MDRLVGLFYAQALRALINSREEEGKLFLPVHFIMDDFAAGYRIEGFDRIISVIRSRSIYASLIIQSVAQLETLYGAAAATIMENCDTTLYLGGNDPRTTRYIGDRANRPPHTILTMPAKEALLFQRGQEGQKVQRYRLEDHYSL